MAATLGIKYRSSFVYYGRYDGEEIFDYLVDLVDIDELLEIMEWWESATIGEEYYTNNPDLEIFVFASDFFEVSEYEPLRNY